MYIERFTVDRNFYQNINRVYTFSLIKNSIYPITKVVFMVIISTQKTRKSMGWQHLQAARYLLCPKIL